MKEHTSQNAAATGLKLSYLLTGFDALVIGNNDPLVTDLAISSRDVTPGALFVAIVGSTADGHRFIGDAIQRGAVAVVVSRPVELPAEVRERVNVVMVSDSRDALTHVAARFFGDPSRELILIGVTGTNGKTTSTWVIEALFAAAGHSVGVIGTVNYRYAGKVLPAPNTTPDLVTFSRLLRDMRSHGVTCAVAEASSHALDQKRVEGLHFDAAIFTNLTRDHLDYHGTMDAYYHAKRRLFTDLLGSSVKQPTVSVTNCDDEAGVRLRQESKAQLSWGFTHQLSASGPTGPKVELTVTRLTMDLNGIDALVQTPHGELHLKSPLLGPHNLENLLGACGVALGLGLRIDQIEAGVRSLKRVNGRLDEVVNEQGIKVLVDYAHTDDALHSVLRCLRPMAKGNIITVFGCGGDRDKGKRPLMGQAATFWSELAIVTSDNPRTESPSAIIEDILPGMTGATPFSDGVPLQHGDRYRDVCEDRRAAIYRAIALALPGDVVLIAGKGHEDYQILGTEKIHFDDREEAAAALALRQPAGNA